MNSGLMEYFQKRQLEIYPLQMFTENYQDIFTPTFVEYLQFKSNPAVKKGQQCLHLVSGEKEYAKT